MDTATSIKLIYVDLFSGAGGTSTGVERAKHQNIKCAKVVACVNHDKNAILSHAANHPDTLHFTEDIRTLNLASLINHITLMRQKYPNALLVLWASLECTNFSKAKGGLSRDADSRTLAESLYRYIQAIDPDYIQIENVEEFMSWGPLDEKGKPISKLAGIDYMKWIDTVKDYLYDFDYKILNAADYGARTSRKRYFGIFAKSGLPIVFPEQTHSKNAKGNLKKWRAVKDVLELEDTGNSIFSRKKPLVDKTLFRIHAGLIKFVAGGKEAFIQQRNSGKPKSKIVDINGPSRTLTSTGGNQELVQAKFISAYYGTGDNVSSINSPSPVVRTKDALAYVVPQFIDQQFGTSRPASINGPIGTIMTKDKYSIVTPFIMDTAFNNIGSSLKEPSGVITANRKWHYLVNPQYNDKGRSINEACFTLIARMAKAAPSITTVETDTIDLPSFIKVYGGRVIYEIYETDSPALIAIKEFMALYGIRDIKMRMLKILELLQIMGFPIDYKLVGTQAEMKKYIGNAVETTMAKVLCEALVGKLVEMELAA